MVGYKTVNYAGRTIKAIAVNNQIPAPTLHYKEGDHVTINVYNHLDKDTAIHWHGVLVPWQMDGVQGISQQGIPPGGVFHYQFTLHQSGTYWYHAHAGLQEQQGLYGAFLIDPPKHPAYHYTKDYVVVLSDWSNTNPDQILANLKKEGDYYSPDFPLQPSLMKFIHDYRKASKNEREQLIDDYKMMQQMRMSIYDISDVAYDAFLLNGHPRTSPWSAPVNIGDTVRLRFIGAGGSTIFHVKIPHTTMQMVHADGNDVRPYTINEFTISPGETYDVLVKIQSNKPYIIYAESIDTVGSAVGALTTSPNQCIDYRQVTPFPEPPPVTREMMMFMMGDMIHRPSSMNMDISSMSHETHSHTHSMNMNPSPSPAKKAQQDDMHMNAEEMKNMKYDSSSGPMKMDDNMSINQSMQMGNTKKTSPPHDMPEKMNMPMNSSMEMPNKKPHSMEQTMSMNHESHSNMSNMNMSNGSMMNMRHGMVMNHAMEMSMPTESTIIGDKMSPPKKSYSTSYGTKYQNMVAAVKTNDPNKPIANVINMELFGYMERFIWFINGVPEYKAKPIIFEPGKRYRLVFTNTSMMHHPMHIHGHWFILRKGNDAYDPLLHTIDVAPGATITADVDTDASGQWMFHCHLLYHMVAGMARTIQYSTLLEITKDEAKPQDIIKNTAYYNRPIVRVDEVRPIDMELVMHHMAHPFGFWLSSFLDIGADPFHNVQRLTYKGLYGTNYNKLNLFINDAEMNKGTVDNADIDIFYWHLISQFWAVKGGVNYFYRPATSPYWQPGIGIEGLMPYFIETDLRAYYYGGSAKFDLELSRDTQITNNFFIRLGARSIFATKTVTQAAIGNGMNQMRYILRPYYRLMPGLNVFVEYEYEKDYGSFRNIQSNNGEQTIQNTVTFGLTTLF